MNYLISISGKQETVDILLPQDTYLAFAKDFHKDKTIKDSGVMFKVNTGSGNVNIINKDYIPKKM